MREIKEGKEKVGEMRISSWRNAQTGYPKGHGIKCTVSRSVVNGGVNLEGTPRRDCPDRRLHCWRTKGCVAYPAYPCYNCSSRTRFELMYSLRCIHIGLLEFGFVCSRISISTSHITMHDPGGKWSRSSPDLLLHIVVHSTYQTICSSFLQVSHYCTSSA